MKKDERNNINRNVFQVSIKHNVYHFFSVPILYDQNLPLCVEVVAVGIRPKVC